MLREDHVMSNPSFEEGYEACLRTTVAALNEGLASDTDKIMALMKKYWGLSAGDAYQLLDDERTLRGPKRQVLEFLIEKDGWGVAEAEEYVNRDIVDDALMHIGISAKYRPEQLIEKIDEYIKRN